ncbi:TPA: RNA-dependent DNA polymerase [Patescibacteria group bacterium]|uniref:Retron-type reverse transcriptase n=2 Tax=Bacteria division Kazan-3B-28 TaxID=1798534 RepID=A0A0G1ZFZ5_UNCK3|nr:MAG: RNA-directed DNA polymerase [candidate division Kazan bacterium GW2011_GWA1_50_15]KKW25516.1 MAG: Retron-type reverse transcriptase [candidate division Kazan bacterium GW2011_GWC1_52_13]KKW26822.1 MAG: Retron-type reverse transcriptase [candidate division Kazan bacterium GW2011_GWB1_52_7]HAV65814.1 RNA-dependent DNA polymerase [Patescibacteria group bacterium]HCL47757.1 RNA-dependent DNA polymerase [Patescibacteria group bacterium]
MKIAEGYYEHIISLHNLLEAWREFVVGKRARVDVQLFERNLMANIIKLNRDLEVGKYRHSDYHPFKISDPKPRNIHKASVRDRLLHKAIYRILYPTWDKTFIVDSYSCRNNKGTHKAFAKLETVARKISQNYTRPCFALKCDIKRFFDSVDHGVLMGLLRERIADERLLKLLEEIIFSFSVWIPGQARNDEEGKGMPLGNLTSQLFANIYLDPLDKFAKHQLKAKYYLRYADDFIFLADNPDELTGYLVEVARFAKSELELQLHPNKISLRKLKWGIDYVGYVALPQYSLPRKKTVTRIIKNIRRLLAAGDDVALANALPSYLGYLKHARSRGIVCGLERLMAPKGW